MCVLVLPSGYLNRASAADNAEQNGDDGNDQQHVDDAAGEEITEEANGPDDYQNDGDDIQEVTHD